MAQAKGKSTKHTSGVLGGLAHMTISIFEIIVRDSRRLAKASFVRAPCVYGYHKWGWSRPRVAPGRDGFEFGRILDSQFFP